MSEGPFWTSPVLVALITVVGGGIATNLVSERIQDRARLKQADLEIVKTYNEHALLAYKEFIGERRKAMDDAYDLVGEIVAASETLIAVTAPEFNPKSVSPTAQARLDAQKIKIVRGFNEAESRWRTRKYAVGMRLAHYYPARKNIHISWQQIVLAVDAYVSCSIATDRDRTASQVTDQACADERNSIDYAFKSMSEALNEGDGDSLEGIYSIEGVRKLLRTE